MITNTQHQTRPGPSDAHTNPLQKYYTCFNYLVMTLIVLFMLVCLFYDVLVPESRACMRIQEQQVENTAYPSDGCFSKDRRSRLLGLTLEEAEGLRRLIASGFLGGILGIERRIKDHAAGIRTLALVSMGACMFTLTSMYAFSSGPMSWDASRVTAAIPSGVGFIGAGLIWKSGETVHGLTTAACIWIVSAIGVSCGGGMFAIAIFGTVVVFGIVRIKSLETKIYERFARPSNALNIEEGDSLESGSVQLSSPEDEQKRA